MLRPISNLLLSAILIPACTDAPIDEPGGVGEGPIVDEPGLVSDLAGATEERPCGDRTAANVGLPNGDRLALCVLDDGREFFVAQGAMGTEGWIDPDAARPACGLELYLANTAADVAVPAALVEACEPQHRPAALAARAIVSTPVIQPAPPTASYVAYNCAAPTSAFASQYCFKCKPYDDCIDWCVSSRWGWHDRTMSFSNFLGEEGNIAIETNASCGGRTRVRAWEREDAGDAWGKPKIDFYLPSGRRSTTGIIHHSAAIFGQDYDFRMRADSAYGASHQHSGYFLDE